MNPLSGIRLTLITEASDTPYSGMLPGHVAGFYSYDECHIDLKPLAQYSQAHLIIDRVVGLDLENSIVVCAKHPPIAFDLLSINIGSTPATISVPGASQYATPVKPVRKFLAAWNQLVESIAKTPESPISLSIVGGGAGGVELAMAMRSRLDQILQNAQQRKENLTIHLFHRDAFLMPHYNNWVRRHVQEILTDKGIQLHLKETVCEVKPHQVKCESGVTVESDRIFWVTQASAPSWLKTSGLATDSKGFILVSDTLQSLSHPHVFAAGDIATTIDHPRPKAGVFAVRQGKPLSENLRRTVLGQPLKPYVPQKRYLSLIGTGDGSAIGSWGRFGWRSPLLWRWKDYIDRQFMAEFQNIPPISPNTDSQSRRLFL